MEMEFYIAIHFYKKKKNEFFTVMILHSFIDIL